MLVVVVASPAAVPAATVLPLTPPLPDLAQLVPFAEAPIEKPPIAIPDLPLPPSPSELPALPLAPIVVPTTPKLTAPVTATSTLACVGAAFGIASKALECGRSHFAKGEFEDAAKDLDAAVRSGKERDLLTEALKCGIGAVTVEGVAREVANRPFVRRDVGGHTMVTLERN